MKRNLRIGIIGCGTIGGFVLDAVGAGKVENAEVLIVCGRSEHSKGRQKVKDYGTKWVTAARAMLNVDLDVIIEAASHEALERHGSEILKAGIDLIPASLGALVDSRLLQQLINSATEGGSTLHIPSGGIGGLDAVQAVINAGVDEVSMTTRKPPKAWRDIPYVEQMNLDLENMVQPKLLYEGPARDCVKKFPQNINIAAALSLAGIGFDATRIRVIADPTVESNTHEIHCRGDAGRFSMILENVPVPENPKTTYMACLSVLATLKKIRSSYRIGT
jgi:aspartate dehydrogenase